MASCTVQLILLARTLCAKVTGIILCWPMKMAEDRHTAEDAGASEGWDYWSKDKFNNISVIGLEKEGGEGCVCS